VVLYECNGHFFFQNLNTTKLQTHMPLRCPASRWHCSTCSSVLPPPVLGQDWWAIRVLPASWQPNNFFAGTEVRHRGEGCGRGRNIGTLMACAATPNKPTVMHVQYTARDLRIHGAGRAPHPLPGIHALYPGQSLDRTRSNSTQLSSPTLFPYIQREK
jgi:hypothetical protein